MFDIEKCVLRNHGNLVLSSIAGEPFCVDESNIRGGVQLPSSSNEHHVVPSITNQLDGD